MDKKSKILFFVLLIATFLSIGFTYIRTMVLNDYEIVGEVDTTE